MSRESPEYFQWRKEVKKRDGRYCQWPDCRKLGRQVHHIIPYSHNIALRTTVSNGIFLCTSCHKKVKNKENDYVILFLQIVEKNSAKRKKQKD